MSTSADLGAGRDRDEESRAAAWSRRGNVVFWALLFGTVVMIGADPTVRDMVADNAADSPFASEETFLVVMRVATFAFAMLLALVQAWIYALVFAVSTASPRRRLMTSWGDLLVAQAPTVLAIGLAYMAGGHDAVADVQATPVRVLLGVVSVIIYAYLAARHRGVERSRVAVFVVLAAAANTALLLLQPTGAS